MKKIREIAHRMLICFWVEGGIGDERGFFPVNLCFRQEGEGAGAWGEDEEN